MEAVSELGIELFGDQLPSLDEIRKLADFVHSSEQSRAAFTEQLEQNLSRTGAKVSLASGIGLCIIGRYQEAVEKLQKGTDCVEKYLYLAYALRRLSRFKEAIESLDKSLEHGAEQLDVTLEKASTYRQAGDFDAAAKELKSCANFERVSAEYHYQLGRLQEAQGLYEEAMDNYSIVLELSPKHPGALFRLAYRSDLSGDEEAAIDYYKQIAAGSPVYVNALLNLAVLYEDRGEFDKASRCVDQILKYHPNHQRAILFKKDIESSKTMFFDEEKQKKRDMRAQILQTPITDFELSVRSRNCFRKMGIKTLGDLLKTTEAQLLSYKNFGETSLREIKQILESKGLRLGGALEEGQDDEGATRKAPDKDQAILNKPVEELNLSVRSRKCLQKLNIRTIGDLVRRTDAELLGCKNFGVTSLNEIKKVLEQYGLSLRTLD